MKMAEYDPTIEDGSMYSSADEESGMLENCLMYAMPAGGAMNSMPQAPPPPSLAVQVAKVIECPSYSRNAIFHVIL